MGNIQPTPGFTPRECRAADTFENWMAETPGRNKSIIERVRKSQKSPPAEKFWAETMEEAEAGWIGAPYPLTPMIAKTVPLTPRFLIDGQHGIQKGKTRVIDDYKDSGVNNLLGTSDASVPDNMDIFLALSTYYKVTAPRQELRAIVVDYKHAYKKHPGTEGTRRVSIHTHRTTRRRTNGSASPSASIWSTSVAGRLGAADPICPVGDSDLIESRSLRIRR